MGWLPIVGLLCLWVGLAIGYPMGQRDEARRQAERSRRRRELRDTWGDND